MSQFYSAGLFGPAIPDSGNLQHRFDPFEESTGSLSTWTDQVGSENLTAGVEPSVVSSGINGNQSVRFDDVDDLLTAQTVSAWNFLHDGSAFSAYLVVEASGSDVFQVPWATESGGVLSSNATGFSLTRDDRDSQGQNNVLRVQVGDGSGSHILNFQSSGDYPANSPEIYCVRFDGTDTYTIDRAKTNLGTPTGTGHTSGDADEALRVGDSDLDPLDSDVGDMLFYGVEHSDSTRDDVVDYLADKFGITV